MNGAVLDNEAATSPSADVDALKSWEMELVDLCMEEDGGAADAAAAVESLEARSPIADAVEFRFCDTHFKLTAVKAADGELWMLANPFAQILQYSNPRNAVAKFVGKHNQRQYHEIEAPRNEALTSSMHPHTKFINRAGLFELIQASRMPKAQDFKRWVNSNLLPTLCDHGDYDMVADAPVDILHGMNAMHAVTNDGASAPWMEDLHGMRRLVAAKTEENKRLAHALQTANHNLVLANQGLLKAFEVINKAREDTAQLANRMADMSQDVIVKPSNPQLLHSLAVCYMGGNQYMFLRPQRRNLQRSLDRLAITDKDLLLKCDYVPNPTNVLNKVKEVLPKEKFTARHNKITLLEDLTRQDLVDAITSTFTQRQMALATINK